MTEILPYVLVFVDDPASLMMMMMMCVCVCVCVRVCIGRSPMQVHHIHADDIARCFISCIEQRAVGVLPPYIFWMPLAYTLGIQVEYP